MTDKVQKIKEWICKEQDGLMDAQGNFEYPEHEGAYHILCNLDAYVDSLQNEPVSVWHNASEEPNDMSHCLIFYGKKNDIDHYLHYEPVIYNKKEKMFVTASFPHPTGYKVEQKSIDGGCVAEVYKNRRDRISISDITQWCYLCDLHKLSNVERIGKEWKEEPASEDLMDATNNYCVNVRKGYPRVMDETDRYICNAFKAGAKWQKEHLFKSADGEDLPKLEKDVVVLVDNFGKLIPKIAKRTYHLIEKFVDEDTGEIISIENTNEVGDVINWTEPAIYWLDAELPKLQEN